MELKITVGKKEAEAELLKGRKTCLFRRLWASEASAETWFESCPRLRLLGSEINKLGCINQTYIIRKV